jgi:replicative DNA helicase
MSSNLFNNLGDLEVEKSLLGAVLLNNKLFHDISDIIIADHFLVPLHQKIYFRLSSLIAQDLIATPITLKQELQKEEIFTTMNISPYDYLKELILTVQFNQDITNLAKIVKYYYMKRKLSDMAQEVLQGCYSNGHQGVENIIEKNHKALVEIGISGKSKNDYYHLQSVVQSLVDRVSHLYQEGKHITGITSGFTDLDAKTGGLQPSDLIILAARPSMGKTSLAINIAMNAAYSFLSKAKNTNQKEQHVLFFSLEMSAEQLTNRMLAITTGIDSSRLRTGSINKFELEKLLHGKEKRNLESLPILIDDTPSLSIISLKSRVIRLLRQYDISLIIVDYLQLLHGGSNKNHYNRVQEIGEISQGLKTLAREINVPVVALSQLSRAVEARDDKKPQLSDLRDSGNIEQDADIVMFLYRLEYYLTRKPIPEGESNHNEWQEKLTKAQNIAELILAKHRNGPIGSLALHFNSATTTFSNLDYHYDGLINE